MRRTVTYWALVALASLGACASPFADPPAQDEDVSLPRDLGESASSGPDRTSSGSGSSSTNKKDGEKDQRQGGDADPSTSDGRGEKDGSAPPPLGENFTVIGSFSDSGGDATAPAPPYADVAGATIGTDGGRAQVVVEMAGALPAEMGQAEVVGLGVDLYRKSGDYQLFASGEPTGWFGYLYTPDGFVQYRGEFRLDTRSLTFTVPWDAIGGRGSGEFGLFLDWTGPGDRYSQDVAPESGPAPFEGSP